MTDFNELGLEASILKGIADQGYKTPTPIQEQAIPLVIKGHDIMGLAQTGTGKTAAFGLPLIHHLLEGNTKPEPKTARALILAPTRELVTQISDNLRHYVKKTPLWISLVIGGQSINSQTKHLARGTDILVATPGRLLDLVKRKAIRLDEVRYLVLDEADQMLDLGFIHALKEIATLVGKPRQTMLFSATMPKQVEALSKAFLEDPVRVEVSPPGKAADKVNQCVHFVNAGLKTELLKQCLTEREKDLSLVFARTKHGAEKLKNHLVDCGFEADSIHGNKSQGQRDRAIKSLKNGSVRILVATDVAARGIDIPGISHVYNYNLPEVPENYVHRIGRTARAGESGEAIAFCAPDEFHMFKAIERLMGIDIRVDSGDMPDASLGKSTKKTRGRSGRKPASGGFSGRRDASEPRRDRNENGAPRRGRSDGAKSFGDRVSRDQSDALVDGKPKRFAKRPDANSSAPHSGKRFKNKQMSVTEYDNREQRRKDTRDEGESRSSEPRRYSGKPSGARTDSRNASPNAGAARQGQKNKASKGKSFGKKNTTKRSPRKMPA